MRPIPNVPSKHYNPLIVTDKVFAGNTALRMQRGLPLPAKYESARGIAVISSEPLPLSAIAAAISQQTGIPVHMAGIGGGSAPVASALPAAAAVAVAHRPACRAASAAAVSPAPRRPPRRPAPRWHATGL